MSSRNTNNASSSGDDAHVRNPTILDRYPYDPTGQILPTFVSFHCRNMGQDLVLVLDFEDDLGIGW